MASWLLYGEVIFRYCHVNPPEAQEGNTSPLIMLQASRLAIAPSRRLSTLAASTAAAMT